MSKELHAPGLTMSWHNNFVTFVTLTGFADSLEPGCGINVRSITS
jgi:hypothetical protein